MSNNPYENQLSMTYYELILWDDTDTLPRNPHEAMKVRMSDIDSQPTIIRIPQAEFDEVGEIYRIFAEENGNKASRKHRGLRPGDWIVRVAVSRQEWTGDISETRIYGLIAEPGWMKGFKDTCSAYSYHPKLAKNGVFFLELEE